MHWTEADLVGLVGPAIHERGLAYWSEGRVRHLAATADRVTAEVAGSEPYQVELTDTRWACDCPMGENGELCKHCVAVAIAAMGGPLSASYGDSEAESGRADLVDRWLSGLDRDALLELIARRARDDESFRGELTRQAARDTGDLSVLREEITAALRTRRRFLDWRESAEYGASARRQVDELARLVGAGHAEQALPIIEDAVKALLRVIGKADDSSGTIGDAMRQLLDVHRWACRSASPPPTKLARWLLRFNLDQQDWFVADVDGYAEALGRKGIEAYRREANERHTAGDESFGVRRSRERLAILDRDAERIVELIGDGLQNWHRYQSLVEAFRELNMYDEALAWSLRGIAEAPLTPMSAPLFEAARDEYLRRGDEEAAVAVTRQRLERMPSVSSYVALRQLCRRHGSWEAEVDQARVVLGPYPEVLTNCLLADDDVEAAWQLAQSFEPSPDLHHRLLKARAKSHPGDVFNGYVALIDQTLQPTGVDHYRAGVKLLRELRPSAAAADRDEDFAALVQRLLAEHHRRPTLVEMLQRLQ
ncbi:MAG: SWIM zinc finger family protein [Nocardioidaceae bacterium]|nr:SWIM zinc finger family protein [Nocardioidaceae bacterium]